MDTAIIRWRPPTIRGPPPSSAACPGRWQVSAGDPRRALAGRAPVSFFRGCALATCAAGHGEGSSDDHSNSNASALARLRTLRVVSHHAVGKLAHTARRSRHYSAGRNRLDGVCRFCARDASCNLLLLDPATYAAPDG